MSTPLKSDMAASAALKASRYDDSFGNLEIALVDMTEELLPDYATRIQSTNPLDLEQIMSALVDESLTKLPKDMALTKRLGSLAVVLTAQLRHAHHRLEWAGNKLKSCTQQNSQLIGENQLLQQQLEQSEQFLTQTETHINELKAQNRAYDLHLDAQQKQTQKMQEQLTEARDKLSQAYHQQEIKERELVAVRREMQYSLKMDQTRQPYLSETFQEERKDEPPNRGVQGGVSPHLFSPLKPDPFGASRTPLDLTRVIPPSSSYLSSGTHTSQGPSDRELDKIARNISHFEPSPDCSHDITTYLKDIDFYLRRLPNATADDRMYLIKVTSSHEVSRFIERQPNHVRMNYDLLCHALEQEFSDHTSPAGLTAAITVKQGRQEPPQQYYYRLLQAYFGSRNEQGMEEDLNFKTLFVQNLHPGTSRHLGVLANPCTSTSQRLRELASLGFAKQMQSHTKQAEPANIFSLSTKSLPRELEGAPGATLHGSGARPSKTYWPAKQQKHFLPQPTYGDHKSSRPHWSDKGQRHSRFKSNFCASNPHRSRFPPNQWENRKAFEYKGQKRQNQTKLHQHQSDENMNKGKSKRSFQQKTNKAEIKTKTSSLSQ
uniref:Uncharacterized protein n=1 Tax=Seriola lalandi dorsalis TaxID=1841481 RepID=A0A3B4XT43_SERLL